MAGCCDIMLLLLLMREEEEGMPEFIILPTPLPLPPPELLLFATDIAKAGFMAVNSLMISCAC